MKTIYICSLLGGFRANLDNLEIVPPYSIMNKTCFYVFFVKLFGNISFDNLISEGDVYLQSFSMLQ